VTATYRGIIIQRVLSAQVEKLDKQQCHSLFHTFFVINNRRARVIIYSGSSNNLVSFKLVKKLGLTTRKHPQPYHVEWLHNYGKVKVTQAVRIHFYIGSYSDSANCDVVPMQACSLLLGRPWEYDIDALHHGRSNKYTLHKGKKITLLPMTPAEILHDDKEAKLEKEELNDKPENQQGIKLKGSVLLATKSDLAEIDNGVCYALICKNALFSIDDIASTLPPTVTNLLQKYRDVFPDEIPPGLPPLRGIEHQINLIPGASLPNRVAYKTNLE
jgi:hypothetical protein